MLGWNRKAVRVTLPNRVAEQVAAAETLFAIAAGRWSSGKNGK